MPCRSPVLAKCSSAYGQTPSTREFSLFDGRRQLIVYRAFFEPGVYGWPEHACRGCSFVADAAVQVVELER